MAGNSEKSRNFLKKTDFFKFFFDFFFKFFNFFFQKFWIWDHPTPLFVRPPWTEKSCNFWEVRIYTKKKNMPQPMTWYVRGHRVYEKHVEVSFPWGKINHSQNECWNIVWFVHTYYSSVWQDCVGNAKSSVKCSRKTKKWRMFKSYIIAYICICVVVPKISGMLPWKCWGMRQKNLP